MPPAVVEYSPACLEHEAGPGHPERPARLTAVVDGIRSLGLGDDRLLFVEPRPATKEELALVHDPGFVDALEQFCQAGGGVIDPDTGATEASWEAALRAAGAGLDAVDRRQPAFCAVRPIGHHASARRAQGFSLFNSIAVAAASLANGGERVLIVDWDVHHGNGTQDLFYADNRVLYVSVHQWPLYPGTGRVEETGEGDGSGYNVNFPVPRGATGDVFLAAMDVVDGMAERFDPTWVLVSCGFDSHRDDLLGSLGLTSADYADLTRRCLDLVPPERCVMMLEGGYELDALSNSAAACVAVLAGHDSHTPPEPRTSGGPGLDVVRTVAQEIRRGPLS
ncbi:MAG: histone deacetylase family protein [Acidimicrobiales bacterium]